MKKLLAIFLLVILSNGITHGQETSEQETIIRPVYSEYTLHAGSAHHADTYLSPIKYSGWTIGFGYQRRQALKFNPMDWVSQLSFDIDIDRTLNTSKNAIMWYAGLDFSYAMLHRWQLSDGFSVGIGPSLALNAGCLYLDRNGNNPASAKAAITLNADGYATWKGKILNHPLTLHYQASIPVTGTFFSPDYGQLYYEIYLGNHDGLCQWAWPGNYFRLRHLLTANLHLGSTSLLIGYRGDIFSSKANNLVTRTITHSAVIGISGEWLSFNSAKKISAITKTISATY